MRSAGARLILTWTALIVLMGAAGVAAEVTGHGRLSLVALAVIAVLTAVKARLILRTYLGLPDGPAMTALTLMVAVTLLIVFGSFAIVPTPPPLDSSQGADKLDARR